MLRSKDRRRLHTCCALVLTSLDAAFHSDALTRTPAAERVAAPGDRRKDTWHAPAVSDVPPATDLVEATCRRDDELYVLATGYARFRGGLFLAHGGMGATAGAVRSAATGRCTVHG